MRDLTPLFAPRSVAVLGASTDPSKWGHWIALAALDGADRRSVHLVNPRGGELAGRPLLTSLDELPEPIDLAVVVVPERALEAGVDGALAKGARGLIVITAGLGETGPAGRAREQALAARVREAGAVMLGPNCIGVFDAEAGFHVSSNPYPAGSVGLVSQSGNLSLELGMLLEAGGLGISRFASIGNQADVTLAELIGDLAAHEPTEVIALYAEDVADGRAFVEAARAAAARKPVIVLTSGSSAAGARGAVSHTGALVSDAAVIDAACRAAGAVRVDSPGALVDAAQAFVRAALPRGRRLLVIGDGGGHVALAADLATAAGLEVPQLSAETVARLSDGVDVPGGMSNPVDVVSGGAEHFSEFSRMSDIALGSGEVDGVLMTGYFGGYAVYSDTYREAEPRESARLAAVQELHGAPLLAHSMFGAQPGGAGMREAGLATFTRVEEAVGAYRALVDAAEARRGLPPLLSPPEPAAPLRGPIAYDEARALLQGAGVAFPDGRAAANAYEAAAAADALGLYPAALKAVDHQLLHKSDLGGVRVGLADREALRAAADDMLERLAPERLFVEAAADVAGGVELVIGVRRDPRFGPVALAGLGGVLVEVLRDTALALAPLDQAEAERLLRSLRGAALLGGVRGRPAVDVPAAAAALVALAGFAAAHPEIAEVEINPLLVTPDGALALDARIVLEEDA